LAVEHAEQHARDAESKNRQRLAENARLEQAQQELERGLEALREAGFERVAEAVERSGAGYEGFEPSMDESRP